MLENVHESWKPILKSMFNTDKRVLSILNRLKETHPRRFTDKLFRIFKVDARKVKVIFFGPLYVAHEETYMESGMAFFKEVPTDEENNIRANIKQRYGTSVDIEKWNKQGVLLVNSPLIPYLPSEDISMKEFYEIFFQMHLKLVIYIANLNRNVIAVSWHDNKMYGFIRNNSLRINDYIGIFEDMPYVDRFPYTYTSIHPSTTEFLEDDLFMNINKALKVLKKEQIIW